MTSSPCPGRGDNGADSERGLGPAFLPTPQEFASIERLAQTLAAISFRETAERYVTRAQVLWRDMPPRYQRAITDFRRSGAPEGALHLAGLPTGSVPPTPVAPEQAVESVSVGAAVLSLIAAGLGEQFGFAGELSGLIVQGVVPVKGAERSRRSVSSLRRLCAHVETSFSEQRPGHVSLFCLRADQAGAAGTTVAPVEAMLRRLTAETIRVLRQRRFETTVDETFLIGAGLRNPITVGDVRVLSGPGLRPRLRVDFEQTRGTDAEAAAALDALRNAATAVMRTVYLASGGMLLIDNDHTVHGRTAFTPRWDGKDRWLLRTFTSSDHWPGAGAAPTHDRVIDFRLGEQGQ